MSSADRYIPACHGVPAYMLPMLRDSGRTKAYSDAISRAIRLFREFEKCAPTVVDLGAGSGLLSKLALEHGAAHVTLMDVNHELLRIARDALTFHGYVEGEHFSIFHGSFSTMPHKCSVWTGDTFDVLVSEIIGTLTTSESQHIYLPDAIKFVRHVEGYGKFVIPQSACQMLSVYKLPWCDSCNACSSFVHDVVMPVQDETILFTSTQDLCLFDLHHKPHKRLTTHVIRRDLFGKQEGHTVHITNVAFRLPRLRKHLFFVLEWKCTLFKDIELFNTIHAYKASLSGVERAAAWGMLIAPTPDIPSNGMTRLEISYPKGRKGFPTVRVAGN